MVHTKIESGTSRSQYPLLLFIFITHTVYYVYHHYSKITCIQYVRTLYPYLRNSQKRLLAETLSTTKMKALLMVYLFCDDFIILCLGFLFCIVYTERRIGL